MKPVCEQVTDAWRKGRVDAVVQSTDKNFMVPVGGAVVAASIRDPSLVEAVNKARLVDGAVAPCTQPVCEDSYRVPGEVLGVLSHA